MFANCEGIVPVRLLSYIHICFMTKPKSPNSDGMVPEKLQEVIEKDSSVLTVESATGSGPPSPGFVSAQCSLNAGMPIIYERSPSMNPSTIYKNCRFGMLEKAAGTDEL